MSTLFVVMAGGFGKRLFPLSTKSLPKQFLNLVSSEPLILESIYRIREIARNILVIGNKEHELILNNILPDFCNILLEPCLKNTLATAIIASLYAKKYGFDNVILFPSDHFINNSEQFCDYIETGIDFLKKNPDNIGTFGVKQDSVNLNYGYIELKSQVLPDIYFVNRFHEKPNKEIAYKYFTSGNFLFNTGIFAFNCDNFLNICDTFQNETLALVKSAINDNFDINSEIFAQIKPNSVDYGVMEKISNVFTVFMDIKWSDLGNWQSVANHDENKYDGITEIGNKGCYIRNSSNIKITACGLENLIIVANGNEILVSSKDDIDKNINFIVKNHDES